MSPIITERLRIIECAYCHREFYASREDAKFCSDPCRLAEWYRKQVEQRDRQQ